MKKVIVTGANGFVGLAVIKKLIEQDYFVYAVVRNKDQYDDCLKNNSVKIIECKMENYNSLKSLISDKDIAFFFHFAWEGTSGHLRSDEIAQLNNVNNSCKAIRIAKEIGCKRFIMASSIMEYEIEQLSYGSKDININHIYSMAKKTANVFCRLIANSIGIEYISGLISNIYGPGEKSQRLINSSLRKFLNNETVKFSPGNQKYDFIYITDAANIFVLIAEKGNNNNSYYIGNPDIINLKDYLVKIGDTLNVSQIMDIGGLPSIGTGLDYSKIDTHKVNRELGYVNEIDFSQGIKKTYEWIKNNN